MGERSGRDSAPGSFLCVRPAASARYVHLGHSGPWCGWHGLMHDASCGILSACTVLFLIRCSLLLFGSQSSWVNASQLLVVVTRANKQWHFPILVQSAGCFGDAGEQTSPICCLHGLVDSTSRLLLCPESMTGRHTRCATLHSHLVWHLCSTPSWCLSSLDPALTQRGWVLTATLGIL